MGEGLNQRTECTAVHDDGTGPALYFAGAFTQAGANTCYRVAAWHRCSTPIDTLCAGDGTLAACPCPPSGNSGNGCPNSLNPGGARLTVAGSPSADDLVLNATQMLPSTVCLFFQGDAQLVSSFASGDGLRCTGGQMRRMYQKYASLGAATAPEVGDLSLGARASALGDILMPGSVRFYQVYYRDPNPGFCAEPTGNTWNLTNGARVVW